MKLQLSDNVMDLLMSRSSNYIAPFISHLLTDIEIKLLYLKYVRECPVYIYDNYICFYEINNNVMYIYNPNNVILQELLGSSILSECDLTTDIPNIFTDDYLLKLIKSIGSSISLFKISINNHLSYINYQVLATCVGSGGTLFVESSTSLSLGRALVEAAIAAITYNNAGNRDANGWAVYDKREFNNKLNYRAVSQKEV